MFPPRNWTETDLLEYCGKKFGIVPRIYWVLEEYGSGNITTSASNIIFSNGTTKCMCIVWISCVP